MTTLTTPQGRGSHTLCTLTVHSTPDTSSTNDPGRCLGVVSTTTFSGIASVHRIVAAQIELSGGWSAKSFKCRRLSFEVELNSPKDVELEVEPNQPAIIGRRSVREFRFDDAAVLRAAQLYEAILDHQQQQQQQQEGFDRGGSDVVVGGVFEHTIDTTKQDQLEQ